MMDFKKLTMIYNKLQDDESRKLFEIMLCKAMSSNEIDYMGELAKFCHNPILEKRFVEKVSKCSGVIIYGCGEDGRLSKLALENSGYRVECFCDTYKSGILVDGIETLSLDEIMEKYQNHLICICSRKYASEIYRNLLIHGVSDDNIFIPTYGILIGSNSKQQYMDVFDSIENGVIVDAGAYDGNTARLFANWLGEGNFSQIVCYEPEEKQAKKIISKIENGELQNTRVIKAGLWDKNTELRFDSNNAGSSISSDGDTFVKCVTLDDTVEGKVSFIKMDVEGAELRALKGAKNIITRDKPKLAICIYHKLSDVYDIAAYIMDIWPNCNFKIRHYTTYRWETVLYVE